uniref:Uncharacterized protein n=1 Tax=Lutzomyia longipalpis TaxID=7200 RepID=A0A7G3B9R2_LUTLO
MWVDPRWISSFFCEFRLFLILNANYSFFFSINLFTAIVNEMKSICSLFTSCDLSQSVIIKKSLRSFFLKEREKKTRRKRKFS